MNILPWLFLLIVVVLGTVGQLSLKYASQSSTTASASNVSSLSRSSLLYSRYFWLWFICYVLVTGLWLVVLRSLPLSQAFPALGMTFALIPLASHYVLRERIGLSQWLGIVIIVIGTIFVVQT
jgi:undecaprenyl phosphate-alpha-L-ara4N flippase subunit ArnE